MPYFKAALTYINTYSAVNQHLNTDVSITNWLYHTLPVVVLYNTTLSDSLTFRSLQAAVKQQQLSESIDLFVCDNSLTHSDDFQEINDEGLFRIRYLHDPENPGVSLSYNRAGEFAGLLNKKWLFVLDQDTIIPTCAIDRYQQAVLAFPNYAVYAPRLYNGSKLFSPCRYVMYRGSNLLQIASGVHSMNYRNVLNSGLLIDLKTFREVGGYDESVTLYFSDFVFFDRLKRHYSDFVIVDCQLDHQLSSVDYSNIGFALKRFDSYCIGARQASTRSRTAWLSYCVTIGLRSLLMTLRFKSMLFVKSYGFFFLLSRNEKPKSLTFSNE